MKVHTLSFVTDSELKPAEGQTMPKALKEALSSVVTLKGQSTIQDSRALWRVLDDLEASKDEVVVQIAPADLEVLKKAWELNLPQANSQAYKWLSAVDRIIMSAKEEK